MSVRKKRPPPNPKQYQYRRELQESFKSFSASNVTPEQIKRAKDCIDYGGPASQRYTCVKFEDILKENQRANPDEYLKIMESAYKLLLKYTINLIRADRPNSWRLIRTNNPAFMARVDRMVKARDILRLIGYTVSTEDSMCFPDDMEEPNVDHSRRIAAELLMARYEVESIRQRGGEGSPGQRGEADSQPAATAAATQQFSGQQNTSGYVPPSKEQLSWQHEVEHSVHSHPPPHPLPHPLPQPTYSAELYSSQNISEVIPEQLPVSQEPSAAAQNYPQHQFSEVQTVRPPQQQHVSMESQSSSSSSASQNNSTELTTHVSTDPESSVGSVSSTESKSLALSKLDEIKKRRLELNRQREQNSQVETTRSKEHHPPPSSTQLPPGRLTSSLMDSDSQPPPPPLPPREVDKPPEVSSQQQPYQPPSSRPNPEEPRQPKSKASPPLSHAQRFTDTSSSSSSSSPPTSSQYCSNCNCKIQLGSQVCPYCSELVTSINTSSTKWSDEHQPGVTPPKVPPRVKPVMRASPHALEEAMREHRQTRPLQLDPVPTPTQPFQIRRDPRQEPSATVPTAHAPAPQQLPVHQQQPAPPPVPPRVPVAKPRAHPPPNEQARRHDPPPPREEPAAQRSPVLPTKKEHSFVDTKLREKEEAWKQHQLNKLHVKPADLQPLPDHEPMATARSKISVDPRLFPRVNVLGNAGHLRQMEKERARIAMMARDGETLMAWIKSGVAEGFGVEEVGLAYEKYPRQPLRFLWTNWVDSIRQVQMMVEVKDKEYGKSVGFPGEQEAREFLVKSKGEVFPAIQDCYRSRYEKVEELMKLMHPRITVPWEVAVRALCRNGMEVKAACWALQCEQLQPLYDFIFGDWGKMQQQDMEDIKRAVKEGDLDEDARCRLLMGEYKLENKDKALMVIELMKEMEVEGVQDYPLQYYIDAAKDFKTLEEAKEKFIKPCPICDETYPIHEMIMMPGCTDSICKDCFKGHFNVVISGKGVKHFNCPMCSKPDLANRDMTGELYLELFTGLIKEHVDTDVYVLCQDKLRDFNLSKCEGFRWCANDQCRSGFINERQQDVFKIQCPNCKEHMCFQCKRPWEEQHKGTSCEKFAQWKQDNDPEAQQQGLAAHLKVNGIECPACHMRYDLARGGCMHFRCTQCPNEFCSGCGKSFKQGRECGQFESCAGKGLHAHHPRDCLFYLRDFDVEELQKFLNDNKVDFVTEPTKLPAEKEEEEGEAEGEGADGEGEEEEELKCVVLLQKELADGLVDEECGKNVEKGHAGLCMTHYKEYLVSKINQAKLDPVTMYETPKIGVMLGREEMEIPDKEEEEEEEEYRKRLIEQVQEKLPLPRLQGVPRPQEEPPQPPPAQQAAEEDGLPVIEED